MADELGSSQQKRKEMIVIEPPNSMTTCWLQHVLDLNFSHEIYVFIKKASHKLFQFIRIAEAKSVESPAKVHEGHLMTSSIVDP